VQRVAFRAILVVSTAAAPLLRLLSETFAYETCARVVLRAHSVDKFLGNRTGAGKLSLPPTPFNILPNQDPTGVAPRYSELWDPQFLLTYYSARWIFSKNFKKLSFRL
jgi:hypothetical protein